MTTQTQNNIFSLFKLIDALVTINANANSPTCATSLDYGFDRDEDELSSELSAPLPANIAEASNPAIDPDEFDDLYKWFIS